MSEKDEGVGLLAGAAEAPLLEVEELRTLVAEGRERGYLTFEEIAALPRGGRGDQGAGARPARPPGRERRGRRLADGQAAAVRPTASRQPPTAQPAARQEAGDRPHRRAQPRLAAAVPALDRPRGPAHRRRGGLAGQAHRARRHGRQAADGRGQPAPGRVDRQGLPGPRALVPRPDPGGLARPDPRGREVRLPARLQVLDLRHLVDPPGRDPRDRRQGAHHPHPGAHGREAQQGRARRAPAGAGVRPRAARPRRSPLELQWTAREVKDILRIAQLPISLEKPIGEEEDSELGDFVEDEQRRVAVRDWRPRTCAART